MTHRERLFRTLERKPVDYPASWLGLPTSEALPGLYRYFQVSSPTELKQKLRDDLFVVDIPYRSPTANHVAFAFDFARDGFKENTERTLTTPGYFADVTDLSAVDRFPWPDPVPHIDPEECRRRVKDVPPDYPIMVAAWSIHYEATCAAFGMEAALVQMIAEPDLFRAVMDRITRFFLQANEIFYRAVGSAIDLVLIGNDLGSQRGLLLSPAHIREFVLPGTRRLVEQAHAFGYKVMHHSCGSIADIIPDLIETGVDVIHPIQALSAGMEPARLRAEFGDRVSFCGGVDAQNLLVNGTPDQVRQKVGELKRLFPTGLIFSPSHEAILRDTKPENIAALFAAVRE
jgi:uroporphyrinogen decarboxylase